MPNGLVADHWDHSISSCRSKFWNTKTCWSKFLIRQSQIILKKRVWSLEPSGKFSVKSLTTHLSPSSPLNGRLYKVLWKTKKPKESQHYQLDNDFWGFKMLLGYAEEANSFLSPSVCPLCKNEGEELQHLFFDCLYSANCWRKFFSIFRTAWAFGNNFSPNVQQLLSGHKLKKK